MSLERTLLLVKPDAVAAGNVEPILQAIDSAGFFLCKRKRRKLSDAEARRLYAAQRGQRHFDNLIAFMTSGESEICELSGVGAVDRLLQLVGPPSVAVARKIASTTFRARYGTFERFSIPFPLNLTISTSDLLASRHIGNKKCSARECYFRRSGCRTCAAASSARFECHVNDRVSYFNGSPCGREFNEKLIYVA